MKIKIIAIGKIKEKYLTLGIKDYISRISHYTNLDIIEIPDESGKSIEEIKHIEGNKILTKINANEYVVSLCIEGKEFNSEELAEFINNHMTYNSNNLVFIIGGSHGLSESVIKRSNLLLSFSKFTFPHQLMRLILLEQIYRSFKIMKNEPYHK